MSTVIIIILVLCLANIFSVLAENQAFLDKGKKCNIYSLKQREQFYHLTNYYRGKQLRREFMQEAMSQTLELAKNDNFPIVLVPGIGGSGLDASVETDNDLPHICKERKFFGPKKFRLWLRASLIASTLTYKRCWASVLSLDYHNGEYSSKKGVTVSVIPGLSGIAYLSQIGSLPVYSYFQTLITFLETKWGYKENHDLYGAPYDWRKTSNDTQWLESIIETAYAKTGKKVVVVAHSMGNLWVNTLFNQKSNEWLESRIQGYASLAAPWLGATKAVRGAISGDTVTHNWLIAKLLKIIPQELVRGILKTFGSAYWLFPHPGYWQKYPLIGIKNPQTNAVTTTATENIDIFGNELSWNMELLNDNWGKLPVLPPRVTTWCGYGRGVPTERHYVYSDLSKVEDPEIYCGDGDGTVNMESLNHCQSFVGNNNNKPVTITTYEGVDHSGVLDNKQALHDLGEFLKQLQQQQ